MQYKIIVDKQSRTNPSADKKEYLIDIEELRSNGNVSDSLKINKDEAYVIRRLKLTEYHVLEELAVETKEVIQDLKIELFEGNNYIYLIDMTGNKFYAEYLINNDFNDTFVTQNEMNSAINESAGEIELTVNQKLTEYSTTEEMNAAIKLLSNSIALALAKKVNDEDFTSAEILLKINNDESEIKFKADKIDINGVVSANKNFQIDTEGNMQCNNAKFVGGAINLDSTNKKTYGNAVFKISNNDGTKAYFSSNSISLEGNSSEGIPEQIGIDLSGYEGPMIQVSSFNLESVATITSKEISAPIITQTSLAEKKKNFEKMQDSALEILKQIDIYKYNLKNESNKNKKHIGFVIGDKYRYSKEVTSNNNTSVDLYSFISLCCKSIQEQQKIIENLSKRLDSIKKG